MAELDTALRGQKGVVLRCRLGKDEAGGRAGVELQAGSLTFDLIGLGDGPAAEPATWRYQLGCDPSVGLDDCESVDLRLGPHIAAGGSIVSIVRGWMECGQVLGDVLPQCRAFVWPPAMLAIGASVFADAMRQWTGRNIFPTRSLIAFNHSFDGAVQSIGLAHFTGQELRMEPPLPSDTAEGERVAAILAGHLALSGRLEETQAVTAPDGSPIVLEPSANRRFVRARRG